MATQYDEAIIQKFADDLYSRAQLAIILGAVKWFIGGFVLATVAQMLVQRISQLPTDLSGQFLAALILAFIGMILARDKAFLLRLEAQKLLVQVQIQRNTSK